MCGEKVVIEQSLNSEEKHQTIILCGDAFAQPVHEREGFEEYFRKIDRLACFLIAKKEDTVCGFSVFYINDIKGKTAFLTLIAVAPFMQGQHIGTALLNESERFARENGMMRMSLKVHCENEKAIRFYKEQGYTMGEKDDKGFFAALKEWNRIA